MAFCRAITPIAIFLLLMLSPIPVQYPASADLTDPGALQDHSPIVITSNMEFTAANGVVAGTGTEEAPYIIENWTLSANASYAITISNTIDHFVIRNCRIVQDPDLYSRGITLFHVGNGKIENNRFENNFVAIYIEHVSNLFIQNNTFNSPSTNYMIGILGLFFDNITIDDNTFEHLDISIDLTFDGKDLSVGHNQMNSSIMNVMNTDDCWIHNNSLNNSTGDAINLGPSNRSRIENNSIVKVLSGSGIVLKDVYLSNLTDNNISWASSSGISVDKSSTFLRIDKNKISTNIEGIFSASPLALISQNDVLSNHVGLDLQGPSAPEVTDNLVQDNDIGISVRYVDGGIIKGNIVIQNTNAFHCDVMNNVRIFNNYVADYQQPLLSSGSCVWNITKSPGTNIVNGSYLGGNFWDKYNGTDNDGDLLGDTQLPYGPGDNHPLKPAPPFIADRTNETPRTGRDLHINASIENVFGIKNPTVDYWEDQGSHKNISMSYKLPQGQMSFYEALVTVGANCTNLSYRILAYNDYTSSQSKTVTRLNVSVLDIFVPTISDRSLVPYDGKPFVFNATAGDNIAISSVVSDYRIDGKAFTRVDLEPLGDSFLASIGIPLTAHNLSYTLAVTDSSGLNKTTVLRTVDVIDDVPPMFVDTSLTPYNGENFTISIIATDNIAVSNISVTYFFEYGHVTKIDATPGFVTITIPLDARRLEYDISCWDSSGNFYFDHFEKNILDIIPPNFYPIEGEPETGAPFNFSIDVDDNRDIAKIELNYSFDNASWFSTSIDIFLIPWGTELNITPTAKFLYYQVTAYDLSSNHATVTGKLAVKDTIPPQIWIKDMPLGHVLNGQFLTIRSELIDNWEVADAYLIYRFDEGVAHYLTYNQTVSIYIDENATNITIGIACSDTSNNIGAYSEKLEIRDMIVPQIMDLTVARAQATKDFEFKASATDNRELKQVYVVYYIDEELFIKNMTSHQGNYTLHIKLPSNAKTLKYTIVAQDGNANFGNTKEITIQITDRYGLGGMIYPVIGLVALGVFIGVAVGILLWKRKPKRTAKEDKKRDR
jgi:parallel beta-helix repeat protein